MPNLPRRAWRCGADQALSSWGDALSCFVNSLRHFGLSHLCRRGAAARTSDKSVHRKLSLSSQYFGWRLLFEEDGKEGSRTIPKGCHTSECPDRRNTPSKLIGQFSHILFQNKRTQASPSEWSGRKKFLIKLHRNLSLEKKTKSSFLPSFLKPWSFTFCKM